MLDEQKGGEESASRLPPAPEFTSLYDTSEFQEYLVPDAVPVLPVSSRSGSARTSNTVVSPRQVSSEQASALSKKSGRRKSVLLAVLVLLLVAGVGGGFLMYASHLRPQPVPAQSYSLPSSPQALFEQVTGRKPALYDLLTDRTTSSWPVVTDDPDAHCTFGADGYHVTDTKQSTFYNCMSTGSYYSNFAFQVQVTILSGDGASLVFRGSEGLNEFYRFRIDQYGYYGLLLSNDPTRHTEPQPLRAGSSQDIHQGTGQMNVLTVIATGSDIYLYINSHFITHERDSTLTVGEIGLSVSNFSQSTEAVFSRAEVWRL
jgi:hypothetical protein